MASVARHLRRLLGLRVEVGRANGNVFYTRMEKTYTGEKVERRYVELAGVKSAQDFVSSESTVPSTWHLWLLGGSLPTSDERDERDERDVNRSSEALPPNRPNTNRYGEHTPTVPLE